MSKIWSIATLSDDGFGWDRALAALFCGAKAGETVSMMAALAELADKPWGCRLCRLLSLVVVRDHCTQTLLVGSGEITGAAKYRAAAALFALFLLLWLLGSIPAFLLGRYG